MASNAEELYGHWTANSPRITPEQLAALVGTSAAPAIVDVRRDEDFALDPRMLAGARRRNHRAISQWSADYRDRWVVVVCQRGAKLSEGTAALCVPPAFGP